jgi:hypothetical protein
MNRILLCTVTAFALAVPLAAHHETAGKSHALATVTIAEPVKAGGKPLAPGTYEVWILNEQPDVKAGAPSSAQRVVELHQNGKAVASEIAEVFTSGERPIGTSGTAGSRMGKAAVQKLQGGEYLRIAITDGGARYLIHLPTASFSQPAPQPQAPSRVEIPPSAAEPSPVPQPQQ